MSEKLRRKLEKNLAALQGPEWNSEDEEEEEGEQPANNSRKRTGNQAKGGTGKKAEPGPVRKKRCCVASVLGIFISVLVLAVSRLLLIHCGLYGCIYLSVFL